MSDVVRVGTVEAGPGEKQFGYLTDRRTSGYRCADAGRDHQQRPARSQGRDQRRYPWLGVSGHRSGEPPLAQPHP